MSTCLTNKLLSNLQMIATPRPARLFSLRALSLSISLSLLSLVYSAQYFTLVLISFPFEIHKDRQIN